MTRHQPVRGWPPKRISPRFPISTLFLYRTQTIPPYSLSMPNTRNNSSRSITLQVAFLCCTIPTAVGGLVSARYPLLFEQSEDSAVNSGIRIGLPPIQFEFQKPWAAQIGRLSITSMFNQGGLSIADQYVLRRCMCNRIAVAHDIPRHALDSSKNTVLKIIKREPA